MKKQLLFAVLFLSVATPCAALNNPPSSSNIKDSSMKLTPVPPNSKEEEDTSKHVQSAQLGKRFLAECLYSIIFCVDLPVVFVYFDSGTIPMLVGYIILLVVSVFPLGKYALNINIVDVSGKEATFAQRLIRAVCKRPPFFLLHWIGAINLDADFGLTILWKLVVYISMLASDDYRGIPRPDCWYYCCEEKS